MAQKTALEKYREVSISYQEGLYTLNGGAYAREEKFEEVVEFLLDLVECKEPYKLILNKDAIFWQSSRTEASILEKIVRINNVMNRSYKRKVSESLPIRVEARKGSEGKGYGGSPKDNGYGKDAEGNRD